ncbi:MAG: GNAT family N-acetyltransferase [Gammaproteobacteria bacterium]|jgi:predicted GNAT family N-acyltransferase
MTTTFDVAETSWEADKKDLIRIRTEVFINEQLVPPDLEWDGYDRDCWQVIARADNGAAIGTGRMLYDGHIGRMAVLPAYRHQGVGSSLLRKLLDIARQQKLGEVLLNAQIAAVAFYEKHGFTVCSDEFMDAGIPHVTMTKTITGG